MATRNRTAQLARVRRTVARSGEGVSSAGAGRSGEMVVIGWALRRGMTDRRAALHEWEGPPGVFAGSAQRQRVTLAALTQDSRLSVLLPPVLAVSSDSIV
ncbi:hypothetical protein GCM10009540_40430 [Streptomyces turgidiscabies]